MTLITKEHSFTHPVVNRISNRKGFSDREFHARSEVIGSAVLDRKMVPQGESKVKISPKGSIEVKDDIYLTTFTVFNSGGHLRVRNNVPREMHVIPTAPRTATIWHSTDMHGRTITSDLTTSEPITLDLASKIDIGNGDKLYIPTGHKGQYMLITII